MKRILLVTTLLAGLATPVYAGVNEGVAAATAGDYPRAFAEFEPLAGAGDPVAQYYLAKLYLEGRGPADGVARGVELMTKSATGGHPEAQAQLGLMYAMGMGVPVDNVKAHELLTKALVALPDGVRRSVAEANRDTVLQRMTPDQRNALASRTIPATTTIEPVAASEPAPAAPATTTAKATSTATPAAAPKPTTPEAPKVAATVTKPAEVKKPETTQTAATVTKPAELKKPETTQVAAVPAATEKPAAKAETKQPETPVVKTETAKVETKAAEKPVEKPAAQVAAKPADAKPADIKPADKPATVAAAKPVDAKPADTKPAEVAPTTTQTASATPATEAQVKAAVRIQIGSLPTEDGAWAGWKELSAKHADQLKGLTPVVESADLGELGTRYRIQVGPFETLAAATERCGAMKQSGLDCLVIGKK